MGTQSDLVRYSRAGDQFHYLWAARRCLGLLSDVTGLTMLSIEGVASSDETESGEEVVDAAEYYDGNSPATCSRINYHQLKHSTVNISSPWTLSGFKKTLAGFFTRYQAIKSQLQPSGNLEASFSFTSNRPVQPAVVEFFNRVKTKTLTQADTKQYELLKSYIRSSDDEEIAAFFAYFRIDDANAGYWQQRNYLHAELKGYLPGPDREIADQLWRLVTEKALPDHGTRPEITREDVLRVLKTDEDELFPAVNLIESGQEHFARTQETDFLRAVLAAGDNPVVIHAEGGVGKTALAQRLYEGLPDGVDGVLYDCFGNGKYRSATAQRHTHDVGLVQIASELASKKLCHPIIPSRQANDADYLKAFRHRIGQAITVLRAENQDAKLVIFVDAADNAQMAAEEVGDVASFARNLIREEAVDGVTFVFLCRTHRIEKLKPPIGFIDLELDSFSLNETSQHISRRFPDATDNDVKEFHRLSSQNPRVQATALEKALSLPETLALLGPSPTSVEDTIRDIFKKSLDKLLDNSPDAEAEQITIFCEALSALRPFIPIEVLSLVSGMPSGAIRSFISDIGRPLTVSGGAVQFFDEPSETWFREAYRPNAEKLKEFVGLLKPLASKNSYVAAVLPQLMLEAGQYDDLVDMALAEEGLSDLDPAERRNSALQRLQFALKAAMRRSRFEDAAKLALKAGGETAGDDRQQSLIQENTHLVSKLYDPHRLREIVAQKSFSTGWYGGQHGYVAALLSGHEDTRAEARGYLRLSHRWVGSWGRLSRKERENQRLDDIDIAEMAFARFNIDGFEGLIEELSSWTPRDVAYRVGKIVFRKLIDRGETSKLEKFDSLQDSHVCVSIALIHALYDLQRYPNRKHVETAFNFVSRSPRILEQLTKNRSQKIDSLGAACAIAQSAIHYGVGSYQQIVRLMGRFIPEPPDYYSQHSSNPSFSAMRARTLNAQLEGQDIAVDAFAGPELKEKIEQDSSRHERDTAEFLNDIGRLLPWHKLWARALVGKISKKELKAEIKICRENARPTSRFSYGDDRHLTQSIARLWMEIILFVDPTETHYGELVKWKAGLRNAIFIPGLLRLGDLCAQNEKLSSHTLDLAQEAFDLYDTERSDAETKVTGYCDIARLVYRVSADEAKSYFNLAIERSGRIGEENMDRAAALLDLADAAANEKAPKPKLAYRFSRVSEVLYDYMARDKYFQWDATTKALLNLCPSSGVSIISRWKDRRFGWPGRLLPIATKHLVQKRLITAKEQLAFLGFTYDWHTGDIISAACKNGITETQATLIKPYIFNRSMSFDGWSGVLECADQLNWDKALMAQRREVLRPSETPTSSYREGSAAIGGNNNTGYKWRRVSDAIAWFVVLSEVDPTDEESVHIAYQRLRTSDIRAGVGKLAETLFSMVPAGQEAPSLEAAFSLTNDNYYSIGNLFDSIPKAWLRRQHIKQVMKTIVKGLCRTHCFEISKSRYHQALPFGLIESVTGLTEREVYQHVVNALSDCPIMLGSGRLFTLAGLMGSMLDDSEAARVLEFGIELLEDDIEDTDGDGPWAIDLEPPLNPVTSLAGYLWATLGSPMVEERWEAAHVVGLLCVLEASDLLSELGKIATGEIPNSFYGKSFSFYNSAAEQWLALALYRAAVQGTKVPEALRAFLLGASSVAERNVLLREYASKACLKLSELNQLVISAEDTQRLLRINSGVLPAMADNTTKRPHKAPDKELEGDDRYVFGHDFDRYWFPDLGRIFGLSSAEIEQRCLKVVRSDWGISGGRLWELDERSNSGYYRERERGLYKSTAPKTEDYQFYISYQSLLTVAGDLISSQPRYQDPGQEDEIANWMRQYLPTRSDGLWLADRRDPRPISSKLKSTAKQNVPWRYSVTREDFDAVLIQNDGLICLSGTTCVSDGARKQTDMVSSALVSPDHSASLQRALQTIYNSRDFRLPSADDDHASVDNGPFQLCGWVDDYTQSSYIDEYDPWAAGISIPGLRLSDEFVEKLKLQPSNDGRFWFEDSASTVPVLTSMIWGEPEDEYERAESDSGRSLLASKASVANWLSELDMDLIFEVQINRSEGRSRYKYEDNEELGLLLPYSLILRMDKHGKFTTI